VDTGAGEAGSVSAAAEFEAAEFCSVAEGRWMRHASSPPTP